MSDKICSSSNHAGGNACETVCIHTTKIYDQCRSKECVRDLRVFLPTEDQCFIDSANVTVKAREAELLYVCMDVEKVAFNRGYYTIDIRFFYKITVEACNGGCRPRIMDGLAVFDKRCILFGGEGGARIFTSNHCKNSLDGQMGHYSNLPTAVVEVVDPIILDTRVVYPSNDCCCTCSCTCNNGCNSGCNNSCTCCNCGNELREVPRAVCSCFQGQELALDSTGNQLIVTLGQFSIIKLERDIQLQMPAYDICMPEKDCCCSLGNDAAQNPCDIFARFAFPVDEFFPGRHDLSRSSSCHCGCGCNTSANNDSCGCETNARNTSGCGTSSASSGCGCNTSSASSGCGSNRTSSGRCGC